MCFVFLAAVDFNREGFSHGRLALPLGRDRKLTRRDGRRWRFELIEHTYHVSSVLSPLFFLFICLVFYKLKCMLVLEQVLKSQCRY